jgi:hypothetical protein
MTADFAWAMVERKSALADARDIAHLSKLGAEDR